MLEIHWSTLFAIAVTVAALILAAIVGKPSGGMFDFSPLLGCGVLLAGAVVALAVLLAHAWGWI